MKKQTNYTGPMRLAHRGLAQAAPENTLGAFQGAVELGLEGMEIDVQLSRDGEIIVAHDFNFTRMTLGHPTAPTNRRICEMTWEEIRSVELPYANHTLSLELPPHADIESMAIMPERLMGQEPGSDYASALSRDGRMAHLMRFADFDAWLSSRPEPITVEVEVKSPGVMKRMLEILDHSPNTARYILFSGVPAYTEEIQQVCRTMGKPCGLRLGANLRHLTEENRHVVETSDFFEIGLNAGCFSKDDVHWLADRGVQVFSNLGDNPGWWEQMCTLGVLGFKTNYAQAFTAWWSSSCFAE